MTTDLPQFAAQDPLRVLRPPHLLRHPQQLRHSQAAGAAVVVGVEGAAGRVGVVVVVLVRPAQTRWPERLVQENVGDARISAAIRDSFADCHGDGSDF